MVVPSNDRDREDQESLQEYLLLVLGDSNLPTGGFVASAGLESYNAHGLLRTQPSSSHASLSSSTLLFISAGLQSYARTAVPFIVDAHNVVTSFCRDPGAEEDLVVSPSRRAGGGGGAHQDGSPSPGGSSRRRDRPIKRALDNLTKLDRAFHASLLNHVARRASRAQGIALLTLYSKAFGRPPRTASTMLDGGGSFKTPAERLIEGFKMRVRANGGEGDEGEQGPLGHLAICWGVFAAAVGLERERAVRTHLFLQARATLSSSIRLNTVGPYLAHSLLLFHVRHIVTAVLEDSGALSGRSGTGLVAPAPRDDDDDEDEDEEMRSKSGRRGSQTSASGEAQVDDDNPEQGWAWDWADEGAWAEDEGGWPTLDVSLSKLPDPAPRPSRDAKLAPVTTWPLGEILQARHDQLHSRLFNS